MRAERITDQVSYHGEGPVWWARWQQLRFVDLFAGDVLTLAGDRVVRTPVGSPIVAALRPRMGGGAIVARERDLAISNLDDLSDLAGFVDLPEDASMRCNDGGCDPDGGFWVGTMARALTPEAGTLYRLDAGSLRARPVLGRLSISNGIGWSPDTQTMYLNDSGANTTWAFDWDPIDGLSNRRVFATPDDDGTPDGRRPGDGHAGGRVRGVSRGVRGDGKVGTFAALRFAHETMASFHPGLEDGHVTEVARHGSTGDHWACLPKHRAAAALLRGSSSTRGRDRHRLLQRPGRDVV